MQDQAKNTAKNFNQAGKDVAATAEKGVNVQVLGFGVDFNSKGGGVTVAGLRGGVSDKGVEAGVNFGLGVNVGEQGAYAGARAGVALGSDGANATAGAKAVGGDTQVGSVANAGVGFDGNTHASAHNSSNVDVATAEAMLRVKKGHLAEASTSKKEKQSKQTAAIEAVKVADREQTVAQKAVDAIVTKRQTLQNSRTKVADLKKENTLDVSKLKGQIEMDEDELETLRDLEEDSSEVEISLKGNSAAVILLEQVSTRIERDMGGLDRDLDAAQVKLVDQTKVLNAKRDEKKAADSAVEAQTKALEKVQKEFDEAEKDVQKAKSRVEQLQRDKEEVARNA